MIGGMAGSVTSRAEAPRRLRVAALVTFAAVLGALFLLFDVRHLHAEELHRKFDAHGRFGSANVDHSAWDRILERYLDVNEKGLNRFDYAALKRDGDDALQAYLGSLLRVDPAKLRRKEQFAFWVNLYNAKTVDIVVRHYPVNSIRDIKLGFNPFGGPWSAKVVRVAGTDLSLDDIEHAILREVWRDPRIHYAVNCASVGCPDLAPRAYTGATLDTMLDTAARAYINSTRGIRFKGSRVIVSSLYKWYARDFGPDTPGILRHILAYAEQEISAQLREAGRIDGYFYDWMLNDAK